MKTIRTILATLSVVLLAWGITALIAVRSDAAFAQRTLYQVFSQTNYVVLVIGVALLAIAVILSFAAASFDAEDKNSLMNADDTIDADTEAEEKEVESEPEDEDEVTGRYQRPSRRHPQKSEEPTAEADSKIKLFDDEQDDAQTDEEPEEEMIPSAPVKVNKDDETARFCIYCGGTVTGDAEFCPKCGKRL